jgi:hypothetical protein
MSNKFQIKRTTVTGRTPNTTSSSNTAFIDVGELALNVTDNKLFSSNGTTSFEVGSNLSSLAVAGGATLNTVSAAYITLSNTGSSPSYAEGRVFYDPAKGALSVYNDEADVTLQVGQENWRRVYNNTLNTIVDGAVVYIDGSFNGIPTVALADASMPTKVHVIGVATHSIESATYGYVTVNGEVNSLDLTAFQEAQDVYLSFSTPGGLTAVSPTFPNYPVQIGTVISNTNPGVLLVHPVTETMATLRVIGDTRIGGDLTISGDFTVVGNVTTTSATSLAISDNFIYVAQGDSVGDTTFTGSGLDDALIGGNFEGSVATHYYVRIDGVGTGTGGVDTFEWSTDNFSTTEATGVDITGSPQALSDGVTVDFVATTGHTLNDKWDASADLVDIDFGVVGNFNTGTYQHAGMFRDATDGRFKFFTGYLPEPTSGLNIDTGHASFAYANLQVGTVFGNLTGTANNSTHFNGQTAAFYTSNTYVDTTFAKLAGAAFTGNISTTGTFQSGNTTITGSLVANTTFQSVGAASFLSTLTVNNFFVSAASEVTAPVLFAGSNNFTANATTITMGNYVSANTTKFVFLTNDALVFADGTTQNTAFRVYNSAGTRIA